MDYVSGISKIIKHNQDHLFILGYVEFDQEITPTFISEYNHNVLQEYPMLKKRMIQHKNDYIFEEIESFHIDDHNTLSETPLDIYTIMNTEFFIYHIYWYIDTTIHKSKGIIMIDHAYCDGYKLIEMLTKPIKKPELPKFNRNIHLFKKIYHCIVGTIVLLIMNIKIVCKMIKQLFSYQEHKNKHTETDYIFCKSLSFSKIKTFTKSKGITVNDFLFALMVKTDYLYTNLNRDLIVSFPININHLNSNNNFIPVCKMINNSFDNHSLFKQIHTIFNHFKYSCYIPIVSYMMNQMIQFMNVNMMTSMFHFYSNHCDYIFTNMISPTNEELKITNTYFLTKHVNNIIMFNVMSYQDNINIICSFKKNLIQHKDKYEECIYKAYDQLLELDTGFLK
jgi:WS/DGAT C-terminal domain